MNAEKLRRAAVKYEQATAKAEEAREARNAAVLEALREGWTHQQISDATGLSRGRISQIKP